MLHQLSAELVGDLIAPGVNDGHGQIIEEQRHELATGRAERFTLIQKD
jgi:hypothetical protein